MNILNHNVFESNNEEIDDIILEDQNVNILTKKLRVCLIVNILSHAQVTSARYEAQGQD